METDTHYKPLRNTPRIDGRQLDELSAASLPYLGYALGAILAGIVADAFGLRAAVWVTGGLTWISGAVAALRMRETLPRASPRSPTVLPGETALASGSAPERNR